MSPAATAARRSIAQQRALKLLVVLTRAANAVTERIRANADQGDLTATEFGILEALYHKDPLLLGDVQKKILLSSGGVTYTVDRLRGMGLVASRVCPTARRARYAALTPMGEVIIENLCPVPAAGIETLMSALSAREQDDCIAMLRALGLSAAEE